MYLLTLVLFQTCMTLFFCGTQNIYILKNAGNQTVSVPIEFHYILNHTVEINGNRNCLVSNILQNIFFCIPQKKFRLRTGWGWVYEDSVFIFGRTIPFMRHILTQFVRYCIIWFASQKPTLNKRYSILVSCKTIVCTTFINFYHQILLFYSNWLVIQWSNVNVWTYFRR